MTNVKVGEMTIQKNESGYTVFFGPIIGSDAPYERLKKDPSYKQMFIQMLRESIELVDEEDKLTIKKWIKDIEEPNK